MQTLAARGCQLGASRFKRRLSSLTSSLAAAGLRLGYCPGRSCWRKVTPHVGLSCCCRPAIGEEGQQVNLYVPRLLVQHLHSYMALRRACQAGCRPPQVYCRWRRDCLRRADVFHPSNLFFAVVPVFIQLCLATTPIAPALQLPVHAHAAYCRRKCQVLAAVPVLCSCALLSCRGGAANCIALRIPTLHVVYCCGIGT